MRLRQDELGQGDPETNELGKQLQTSTKLNIYTRTTQTQQDLYDVYIYIYIEREREMTSKK